MIPFILTTYGLVLSGLMFYGLHRYWILFLYWKHHKKYLPSEKISQDDLSFFPPVTVQLPLFNEQYVAERLLTAVSQFDYPKEKLEIQVLDDSTDETTRLVEKKVVDLIRHEFRVLHLKRSHRAGYKAGALAEGLKKATGEFIAIFDADFLPPPDFLKKTLPPFSDSSVGMVQTRWGHINQNFSLLTRLQAMFLDGHFLLEHTARYKSGALFNFNGTAGVWRKTAIEAAGGWSARTLTEDLDLSYRAQLAGWKFVYLPNYVCPAELPVNIHAFLSQQRRWTQGAIQVGLMVLKDIWRSRLSFHAKCEATIHLTGNVGYLLTVLVVFLLLPRLYFHQGLGELGSGLEFVVFISTTLSIAVFYLVSQKELYADWKVRVKNIPVLMAFGVGICMNSARAVIAAFINKPTEFVRTPKYDIKYKGDSWRSKNYQPSGKYTLFGYGLCSIYSMGIFLMAIRGQQWAALPLLGLFMFGFGYVWSLCFKHRRS